MKTRKRRERNERPRHRSDLPVRALVVAAALLVASCGRFIAETAPPEAAEGYACRPESLCRGGTTCLDGHCRYPCSRGCPRGYECTLTTADGSVDYCRAIRSPPTMDEIGR